MMSKPFNNLWHWGPFHTMHIFKQIFGFLHHFFAYLGCRKNLQPREVRTVENPETAKSSVVCNGPKSIHIPFSCCFINSTKSLNPLYTMMVRPPKKRAHRIQSMSEIRTTPKSKQLLFRLSNIQISDIRTFSSFSFQMISLS